MPLSFLIAHLRSTCRNSDVIFLLEEGRNVEQGTYDYLNPHPEAG